MESGAAAAADGPDFSGKYYLCGQSGHMKHDCPEAKEKKQIQAKNAQILHQMCHTCVFLSIVCRLMLVDVPLRLSVALSISWCTRL